MIPSGPGPLPLPSGVGPLPLPLPFSAGQGPIPAQSATPSYYYGSQSMDGFPSQFQQVGLPSFQSPRPWQTAPSFSYGSAQPMNFAPQQGIPPPGAPPIYLQQSTSSFGSVPSKFLSPPPPSSFLTPISFGGPANSPVFPSSAMQPSFQVAQPAQYNPVQSYGPSMMQLQQGNDASAFGTTPQTQQIAGPSSYSPQSYGFAAGQQFSGTDSSSQSFGGNPSPQQSFAPVGSQQPMGPPIQTYSSASQQQSYGQAPSPQVFAQGVPQQSFSPVETQQSFGQASFEQTLGPSVSSQSYPSQQQSYGTALSSFSPAEVQQQQQFVPSESQQFVGVTSASQSFAPSSYGASNVGPSPVEGFPDMQPTGNPVPIYGVPPPSSQSDFQQSNSQDSSTPIRQQGSSEFLMPVYQSAAMASSPLPDSTASGPNSGSTYDTSSVITRYVRVRN